MPAGTPPDIAANAELARRQLATVADVPFGFDADSVAWLDGFIERFRTDPGFTAEDHGLVSALGSYLGEAIVTATGGWWRNEGDGHWGVILLRGGICFPFTMVDRQLRHGAAAGESILRCYDVVKAFTDTGRLSLARGVVEPSGEPPAGP